MFQNPINTQQSDRSLPLILQPGFPGYNDLLKLAPCGIGLMCGKRQANVTDWLESITVAVSTDFVTDLVRWGGVKKQELGFSTGTDLSEKKLAVSEGAKELQSAKDGLTLLKRQLNDLMGREIDEELIITPPELTRTIETAPAYSEELLKTATDKNYKLKTLRRDKQQAEADSKKNDRYDGQLKASRVDMQLADVSTEEEKVNIANDLKKKLDAINTAAAEYQNKKDANSKAKIEWEQQQKSAKLGLVSAVELQALELQYEQTEMELSAAAYAYDLAWEEYTMLMNGTTLDIYDVYKSKLS